ncbi:hypothetical protein F2Q65_02565 [Thiohalocapsa marina]|uniref:Uncharacterized protein n=1 Tax=Thiohalocapsa marina TaxID=424902 RepID=A0A5M8FUE2_9GAMM|nr:AsmA-like C-terminal region-containing protein [Thiohalocapsa marina]KAA6187422.1 hypothetical protein F2Q65_02565 [Thiohalocapsa marina]
MRLMKRLLLLLLALVGLSALALVTAGPLLIDRESMARRLEAAVMADSDLIDSGWTLHLGAISDLRLLPHPRVEMQSIRLTYPVAPEATQQEAEQPAGALSIERLAIEGRVLPLLQGRLELASIRVQGLALNRPLNGSPGHLPHDAQHGAGASSARHATEPATKPVEAGTSADLGPVLLPWWQSRAQRLDITADHVTLHYPADQPGPAWSLSQRDGDSFSRGGTARVDARLHLTGDNPRVNATLTLESDADVVGAAGTERLRLRGLRLQGEDVAFGAARPLPLELTGELDYLLATGRTEGLHLRLASGALRLRLRDLAEEAPGTTPMQRRMQLEGLDLRAWLAEAGRALPGSDQTLRCVAGDGLIALTPDGLTLSRLRLSVDGIPVAGAARLGSGRRPGTELALSTHGGGVDLTPYLASRPASAPDLEQNPEQNPDPGPTGDLACDPVLDDPAAWPALPQPEPGTDLRLTLAAGQLHLSALDYQDLSVDARVGGGVARAQIAVGAFYAGTLRAELERPLGQNQNQGRNAIAAPGSTTALRGLASEVDLGRLLEALRADAEGTPQSTPQIKPQITGTAEIRADLTATGHDAAAMRETLAGNVAVSLRDSRVAGLELDELLIRAGVDPVEARGMARLSTLTATAQGRDGVFLSDDILGHSPLLRVQGSGRFEVPTDRLQLDLEAELVQSPQGPDLRGLEGIRVPISARGDWRQPAWRMELGPALGEAAQRLLQQQLEDNRDALKALEERTGIQGLEQGLRGLLGL